jgi:uncharacterized protein (UPF0332 family)
MKSENDPKAVAIASLLKSLSLLERDVADLYRAIGRKVSLPLAQSLLFTIAIDSQKHSTILKGVGETIAQSHANPKECEEKLHEVYEVVETFRRKTASKKEIGVEELPQLAQELTVLEGMLGEEYYVFVQMRTLEFMVSQINNLYHVDLGHLRNFFSEIISDEEHHRELLETIRDMLNKTNPQTLLDSPETMLAPPSTW